MLITADQIRAARALKNWSQTDLAERTGLAVPTIANIELGKQMPGKNTMEKIIDAFTLGGIDFTERGVEKKDEHSKFFIINKRSDEDNIYPSLLQDIYFTLSQLDDEEKEFLVSCGDDRISPPEVNAIYKKMRSNGIRTRHLVEEGNSYLLGQLEEYRCLPKEYFLNNVTIIYGTKYAVCIGGRDKAPPESVIIFNDEDLAHVQRNLFEFMWSKLPMPKKSTAPEAQKFPASKKVHKKKGRK